MNKMLPEKLRSRRIGIISNYDLLLKESEPIHKLINILNTMPDFKLIHIVKKVPKILKEKNARLIDSESE